MKKLFLAALAVAALAACNTKVGPEYTTRPHITEVGFTPEKVTSVDKVSIRATVTSKYGLQRVLVSYYIGEMTADTKVQTAFDKYYAVKGETTKSIEATIAAQPAGTKVTFQIAAISHYNIGGASQTYTYTVVDDPQSLSVEP